MMESGDIWYIMRFSDCTWGTLKWLQVRVVRQALSGNVFRTIASLIFPTTMKVFDNQDVGAHSCMVRKLLFSSFEVPTMEFRGLQELFLPFRNDDFIHFTKYCPIWVEQIRTNKVY